METTGPQGEGLSALPEETLRITHEEPVSSMSQEKIDFLVHWSQENRVDCLVLAGEPNNGKGLIVVQPDSMPNPVTFFVRREPSPA